MMSNHSPTHAMANKQPRNDPNWSTQPTERRKRKPKGCKIRKDKHLSVPKHPEKRAVDSKLQRVMIQKRGNGDSKVQASTAVSERGV